MEGKARLVHPTTRMARPPCTLLTQPQCGLPKGKTLSSQPPKGAQRTDHLNVLLSQLTSQNERTKFMSSPKPQNVILGKSATADVIT